MASRTHAKENGTPASTLLLDGSMRMYDSEPGSLQQASKLFLQRCQLINHKFKE